MIDAESTQNSYVCDKLTNVIHLNRAVNACCAEESVLLKCVLNAQKLLFGKKSGARHLLFVFDKSAGAQR